MTTHLGASTNEVARTREVWALGLITIGLITGPIGPAIGLFLVVTSKRWTPPQKLLAAALPFVIFGLLLLGGAPAYTCTQVGSGPEVCDPHPPLIIPWMTLIAALIFLVSAPIYLFKAAKRS